MTHETTNAQPPGITAAELAEANASHAIGRYLANGPSMPYTHMKALGFEGSRGWLDNHQTASTQTVSGWLAVEQAFIITANPGLRSNYPIDPLFDAAEDAFTNALDLYDPDIDSTTHLWEIELAMAALPLYRKWVAHEALKPGDIKEFHEEVVEVGHKLLALKEEEGSSWSSGIVKDFNGFASEVVTVLAYNRRQKDGSSADLSFAVPSTYRQNMARMPRPRGGNSGSKYDKTLLRGNWDISLVEQQMGKLVLTDKLQVKTILRPEGAPQYDRLQNYTADVTVVSVQEHLCPPGTNVRAPWEPLETLLVTSEPGASKKEKVEAARLSRELYARIDLAADERKRADDSKFHVYRDLNSEPIKIERAIKNSQRA